MEDDFKVKEKYCYVTMIDFVINTIIKARFRSIHTSVKV